LNTKSFRITGSDVFVAFQIFMAYYFALPQAARMLDSVQGVTINWLLCAAIFTWLNLILSVGVYRKEKCRTTLQTLLIYANWTLLLIPMVTIAFIKCAWTKQDSVIFSLIMVSAVAVIWWGKRSGRAMSDPVVRGMLVGLFRVVPHLFMAYCIFDAEGSNGLAPKAVFAANVTASARIVTLYLSGRKTKWGKGVQSSFLAESANEASWLVTTALWYVYR